jgi:tetratricopeptide (TPR) repeat protein
MAYEIPGKRRCRYLPSFLIVLVFWCAAAGRAADGYWAPKDPPKAHYRIEARIDLDSRLISGTERITLKNTAARPLEFLAVDWQIRDDDSLDLRLNGAPLTLINPRQTLPLASPLVYRLPLPLAPGEEVTLMARFATGLVAGSEAVQIGLNSWYPRLWWDGLPVHDSFEVKVNDLPGFALAVSGRLDPQTGFYKNDGARTFGLYYGRGLLSAEREVEGVLVRALFTEKGAPCARFCLDAAADVIRYYKNWLGFYPFPVLTILPGAPDPIGGYPMYTGVVVIHGQEKFDPAKPDHWTFITAHEIGHQYWSEYVLEDDHPDWLWIGLGIYADRSYCRASNILPLPQRAIMEVYFEGVSQHLDTTEDRPAEQVAKIAFDYNNIVVHGKGFAIISALENVLGRDVFEGIYKACLKAYGGRRLGWREFQRFCEEESGRNLKWFFEQWVRSNKVLSVRVKAQACVEKDGRFESTATVESLGSLRMPISVEAVFEDGSKQRQLTDRLFREQTLTFLSESRLRAIVLDPDKELANIENLPPPTAGEVAGRIEDADWTGIGELALDLYDQAKMTDPANKRSWFKLGLLLFDGGYYPDAFDAFRMSATKSRDPRDLFGSEVWMGILQDLMGNRAEAIKHYQEALKRGGDSSLQHGQYGLKIDRAWVGERLKSPFTWGKKRD